MKTITLSKNKWHQLPEKQFFHATDGKLAWQNTTIRLKYDEQFLFVEFNCDSNPFVDQNTYFEHNSEMYNQEVFELFIAEGDKTPKRYLEIEINPNNALFVGWIHNTSGESPEKLDFVTHQASGIMHGIQKSAESWSGFLSIPMALIGNKSTKYRLNFYRIISKESHTDKDWKCTQENCDFTCWNSTMSGNNPRFHRPSAFGRLILHNN